MEPPLPGSHITVELFNCRNGIVFLMSRDVQRLVKHRCTPFREPTLLIDMLTFYDCRSFRDFSVSPRYLRVSRY